MIDKGKKPLKYACYLKDKNQSLLVMDSKVL